MKSGGRREFISPPPKPTIDNAYLTADQGSPMLMDSLGRIYLVKA
jgi:hypothetical protein